MGKRNEIRALILLQSFSVLMDLEVYCFCSVPTPIFSLRKMYKFQMTTAQLLTVDERIPTMRDAMFLQQNFSSKMEKKRQKKPKGDRR